MTAEEKESKTKRRPSVVGPPAEASGVQLIGFRILQTQAFDYAMGSVILFNMVVIIMETDEAADDRDPSPWIGIASWSILAIFLVELLFRLYVLGCPFFDDGWNRFDCFVVVTDVAFSGAGLIFGNMFPMSTLRVFRLCKLARMSKVFRVFPELRLMMAGLVGSIRAIFWGMILLAFFLLVWAIIAVQFIHPLNKDLPEGAYTDCERCPRAYASVFASTVTFSQQIVAGDSWGQATIPLIEHYPLTGVYFAGVFLTIGMAVLNLILGVVVNVAQRAHDDLKVEIEDEQRMERMEVHNHLLNICSLMDTDGSGELTKEELELGYQEREDFRNTFLEMDLKEEDLEIVWTIMDVDRSGKVSYAEFVNQIYKLKNSDTQFMLAYIKYYITIIKNVITDQMNQQQEEILKANHDLEEEMIKVEAEEKNILNELAGAMRDPVGAKRVPSKERSETPSEAKIDRSNAKIDQSKEDKSPIRDAVERKSPVEEKNIASQSQVAKEVLDDSLRFQQELKELMQDIKLNIDLHMSSTSKLLFELVPHGSADSAVDLKPDPSDATCGFSSARICCKSGASVKRVLVPGVPNVPQNDVSIGAPPSTTSVRGFTLPRTPPAGGVLSRPSSPTWS